MSIHRIALTHKLTTFGCCSLSVAIVMNEWSTQKSSTIYFRNKFLRTNLTLLSHTNERTNRMKFIRWNKHIFFSFSLRFTKQNKKFIYSTTMRMTRARSNVWNEQLGGLWKLNLEKKEANQLRQSHDKSQQQQQKVQE